MHLIPVIDVMGGQVVHGKGGNRALYRPIVSPLGTASDPAGLATALLAEACAETLYIADLDAITGGAVQRAVIADIAARNPHAEIWLDAGFRCGAQTVGLPERVTPVMGSETMMPGAEMPAGDHVLSLDFKGDDYRGPRAVLDAADGWPMRVIAMQMAAVGSDAGPDIALLRQIVEKAGSRRVYAAGGVRNNADLAALSGAGCAGALVASALHSGKLRQAGNGPEANTHRA